MNSTPFSQNRSSHGWAQQEHIESSLFIYFKNFLFFKFIFESSLFLGSISPVLQMTTLCFLHGFGAGRAEVDVFGFLDFLKQSAYFSFHYPFLVSLRVYL